MLQLQFCKSLFKVEWILARRPSQWEFPDQDQGLWVHLPVWQGHPVFGRQSLHDELQISTWTRYEETPTKFSRMACGAFSSPAMPCWLSRVSPGQQRWIYSVKKNVQCLAHMCANVSLSDITIVHQVLVDIMKESWRVAWLHYFVLCFGLAFSWLITLIIIIFFYRCCWLVWQFQP